MQDLLAGIEASALAAHLRGSRWTYPLVNAGHVLGISLLVGAIAALDLRLMGLWPRTPLAPLAAVLRPVAASGLALAALTGVMLFSVQAREYAATPLFWLKMALLAAGLVNAALFAGSRLLPLSPGRRRLVGVASLTAWVGVLLCGRLLGYL